MDDTEIIRVAAENIRQARKSAGLSQEELALEAAVDRTYVSQVERGKRNMTIVVLSRLAQAMGTNPAALLSGLDRKAGARRRRDIQSGLLNALCQYGAFPCLFAVYLRWWGDDWLALTLVF